MKEYTFEYTKQGAASLLFGLSFGIIGIGIFFVRTVVQDAVSTGIAVITLVALAVAFFLLNKHRIKRTGTAKLSVDDLILSLDETINIPFTNLKYYYIYDGKNGIVCTLGFLDGTKLKTGANNNFCNDESIKVFLDNFQAAVENYKAEKNANIIHLETIFARKKTVYILSALTILTILGFCFMQMPVMILAIAATPSVLIGWIRYFQQRSKDKLVDF